MSAAAVESLAAVATPSYAEGAAAGSVEPRAQLAVALPEAHQHAWRLRVVEFDAGTAVREYECESCTGVWYA
jgi:hypothetical protein